MLVYLLQLFNEAVAVDRGCARRRRTTTAARPLLGLASRRGGD
jgi:hypothetical protein